MVKLPGDPSPGRSEKKCIHCDAWNAYDAERCTDCGVPLGKRARKPKRDAEDGGSSDGRCEWNINGKRCHYPAAVSGATNGAGPWYCGLHANCSDARIGADYVEASRTAAPYGRAEREAAHDVEVARWLRDNETGGTREECMAMMRALPGRMRGGHISREWARHVLARRDAGETVPGIAIEKAELALGMKQHMEEESAD